MSVSLRDIDTAFQGAGQKAGLEIWRIENFRPVPVQSSSYGKFYTGDSYIVLKTTALKSGGLRQDIHFWLGKETSQDEAGAAALKTVELDAALGGRAVQYREVQGHESEKFLSYFKPCIMPLQGGVASGFKHHETEEYTPRLFVCRGKHVVRVNEVPCTRSSLSHDDIFILDTESKIFQFNGSNSTIQERAKALEVVQHIKDNNHHGKCDIAAIEDGRLMADADSGEFWAFFGGFAPLPRKMASESEKGADPTHPKLLRVEKGKTEPEEVESLTRDILDTNKCYILDCGNEVFVWMGRNTTLDGRKSASGATEDHLRSHNRPKSHVIRIIEGFETVDFKAKFDSWPSTAEVAVSEEGRGKVAALLKRQGVNVKGLVKTEPPKDEPEVYIDCTGNLQVWRVNGNKKDKLSSSEQSKFYSGDCYIFQYSYPGEDKEDYLIGTWFGKQSVQDEQMSAITLASKMVETLKFVPTQARFYEGSEPVQFFAIFQSFIVFKGGLSEGYKKYIAEKEIPDDTYTEDSDALFRVQGSGPDNMQAIQVDLVSSSLNSSYCYILHSGSTVFSWSGNLTSSVNQELVERQLDIIKPDSQCKTVKEGAESEQFWKLLGGKTEYPSQKIARVSENDPHLFSCHFSKGVLKVVEVHNFSQDDLMTEDIFILDCHSNIFVWVGQQVDSKTRLQALTIGENFVERDFLLRKLSPKVPIYVITEGNEPPFFTRFFSWDSAKSGILGNSFQRKLALIKNGGTPVVEKPKRRTPVSYGGRSSQPDKSAGRSRSMSFSPDRVRVRGRSPAFNALAATFENASSRNLSTPPPIVRKLYPKSGTPDSGNSVPKAAAIASLTATFEKTPRQPVVIPRSRKVNQESPKETPTPLSESNSKEKSTENIQEESKEKSTENIQEESKEKSMGIIQEDSKEDEVEDEVGLTIYPYERLTTTSQDPVSDIDVTKRETYLSAVEFKEKFGMEKEAFYKLPKWKQNKLKMALQLF